MGGEDTQYTWIGYRDSAVNRPRHGFYELIQFDEAYKYFNDSYNYVKERTFQDRAEKQLEFYFPKGAQVRFFHKKQIKL